MPGGGKLTIATRPQDKLVGMAEQELLCLIGCQRIPMDELLSQLLGVAGLLLDGPAESGELRWLKKFILSEFVQQRNGGLKGAGVSLLENAHNPVNSSGILSAAFSWARLAACRHQAAMRAMPAQVKNCKKRVII